MSAEGSGIPAVRRRNGPRPGVIRRCLASFWSHHRPLFSSRFFCICFVWTWGVAVGLLALNAFVPMDWRDTGGRSNPVPVKGSSDKVVLLGAINNPVIFSAVIVAAVNLTVYGRSRATIQHPFYRSAYRWWLENTPWRHPRPLPMGPVHLTWHDVVPVGFVLAPFWQYPQVLAFLAGVFLAAYACALAAAAWASGASLQAYATTMILGLVLRMLATPYVACAVALAAYLVAWQGLNRTLAAFPWPRSNWFDRAHVKIFNQSKQAKAASRSGTSGEDFPFPWPVGELVGPARHQACSIRQAGLAALQAAWWTYAAIGLLAVLVQGYVTMFDDVAIVYSMFVIGVGILRRFFTYREGFAPPVSWLGRIALRKLVWPTYDRALVAPGAMLVAGAASIALWQALRVPPQFGAAATNGLTVFLGLAIGPSYSVWRLTGGHRLTPRRSINVQERAQI